MLLPAGSLPDRLLSSARSQAQINKASPPRTALAAMAPVEAIAAVGMEFPLAQEVTGCSL